MYIYIFSIFHSFHDFTTLKYTDDGPPEPSSPSLKRSEEPGVQLVYEIKCKLYIKVYIWFPVPDVVLVCKVMRFTALEMLLSLHYVILNTSENECL